MILTYEAIDEQGRATEDILEAASEKDAVDQLRGRGLYVTHIAKASRRRALQASVSEPPGGMRLPLNTLVLFTRQMAMLLRAGSAVVPAIAAIRKQMKKSTHAALLGQIVTDLGEGATLTEAFRKHPASFDGIYCAIVAAGEASATLDAMFDRLALIVAKRRVMRNQILGALSYPAVLIGLSSNILASLLFFVIPRFSDMFVQLDVEPPYTTRMLLAIGCGITDHWLVLLAGVIGSAFAVAAMLNSARGRQWLIDVQTRVPLLGRLRSSLIQAQVFRTMGVLLESGVSVLDTLELVRRSTLNSSFQTLFSNLEAAVTAGGRLSTAFEESDIVASHISQAIHTGEDSGNLGGSLTFCADILDEANSELINVAMKLIEPLILVGMGLVVGGVAISLFLPLFDLTSAMH